MADINEFHQEEILIQLVEQKRCLYDKSFKSYMDKVQKKRAWEDIADKFLEISGRQIESKCIYHFRAIKLLIIRLL